MAFHPVCPVDQFPEGTRRTARADDRDIVLFHLPEGLFALHDRCPHRGGLLSQGDLEGPHVHCPLHAWRFDLRTGSCPELPGVCVARYEVRVREGVVELSDEGTLADP